MIDIFYNQVRNTPNKIAVRGRDTAISYYELNRYSNRLSNFIKSLNIQNKVIGIWTEEPITQFIAMIACLKMGIPFININRKAPLTYNMEVLQQLEVDTLLVDHCYNFGNSCDFITINVDQILKSNVSDSEVQADNMPLDIAYIVSTSGTTDKPKLVLKKLISLERLCGQIRDTLPFLVGNTIYMTAPLSFAFGLDQSLAFLCLGTTICVHCEEKLFDFKLQYKYFQQNHVKTVFWAAPVVKLLSRQPHLFDGIPDSLDYIVTGGEPIFVSAAFLFELKNRNIKLVNNYGCTEIGTMFFSCWNFDILSITNLNPVPIGVPLPGFEAEILLDDSEKNTGQLVIIANDFYNEYKNDLISIRNKFKTDLYGRSCFYTGDIAKKVGQDYYIVGRDDNCVNIHGFRVEIEAVEMCVSEVLNGNECVVVPYKSEYDEIQLFCFYVGSRYNDQTIIDEMKKLIPYYMIPTKFFNVLDIPKLSNGKINRKNMGQFIVDYIESRQDKGNESTEKRILTLISNMTKQNLAVNITECTFSDIGFDSLSIVDFLCAVEQQEGILFDYNSVYAKSNTIGEFIDVVRAMKAKRREE